MIVPPLLYAKAGLPGEFANIRNPVVNGTEPIGSRRCYGVAGTTSDFYGATGHEVNIRKTTWQTGVTCGLQLRFTVATRMTGASLKNFICFAFDHAIAPSHGFDDARVYSGVGTGRRNLSVQGRLLSAGTIFGSLTR